MSDVKVSEKLAWAKDWLGKEKKNFIAGRWVAPTSDRQFKNINPSCNELLAEVPMSGSADVDAAVLSARRCFEAGHWHRMNMRLRARKMRQIGEVLRDHFEELAALEALANGKTFSEALNDDMPDCADVFDYYAGWIDKITGENNPVEDGFVNFTTRQPMGVCGLIVPWNFPLLMACWKMAPALATGNSVVIKPSEYTPFTLMRMFELIHEKIEFPEGLLNLVLGDGEVGQMMSSHSGIDKISFTGSTAVGKKIVRSSSESNLKSVSLELGGKSPVIFFEDTEDLDEAIDRSFHVMFAHKGEKCTEPTRFYFHKSIYQKALDRMAKKAEAIVCGDGFAEGVHQGPQCYEAHFEKVMNYIESAKKEGAELIAGGSADTQGENSKGFFVRPTIFADVSKEMKISKEEIFGPVLAVNQFESEAEALELANASDYGLAAGIYTANASRAHRVANQLEAGMVFVNRYGCYEFSSPFGGFKQSGWGKEMGAASIDAYTKSKSIWLKI